MSVKSNAFLFVSSFDRMAEAAQRQAFVGRGPQTGHKNKSSVKLG